jgi:hypothetical protein
MRLATELDRELGVPMRLANWHSPSDGGHSIKVGRTATADHLCCSSSNKVASRSKLILGGFKRCSTAIRCTLTVLGAGKLTEEESGSTIAALPSNAHRPRLIRSRAGGVRGIDCLRRDPGGRAHAGRQRSEPLLPALLGHRKLRASATTSGHTSACDFRPPTLLPVPLRLSSRALGSLATRRPFSYSMKAPATWHISLLSLLLPRSLATFSSQCLAKPAMAWRPRPEACHSFRRGAPPDRQWKVRRPLTV